MITAKDGTEKTCMIYDMENFMNQCIIKYLNTTGAKDLKTCGTPFWTGPESHGPAREAYPNGIDPNRRSAADWMAAVPAIDQPNDDLPGAAGEQWLSWSDSEEGEGPGLGACNPTRTAADFAETNYLAPPR